MENRTTTEKKCVYENKEYSNGALICRNQRELRCDSGEWQETGETCSPDAISALPGFAQLTSGTPKLNSQKLTCVQLLGTGNEMLTVVNTCDGVYRLDIRWEGYSPPRIVSYRVHSKREIRRQDLSGTLVAEAPAIVGGLSAEFRTEEVDMGNDTKMLLIVNPNRQWIYFEFAVEALPTVGSLPNKSSGNAMVAPLQRFRLYPATASQLFVTRISAWLDPD